MRDLDRLALDFIVGIIQQERIEHDTQWRRGAVPYRMRIEYTKERGKITDFQHGGENQEASRNSNLPTVRSVAHNSLIGAPGDP